MTLESSLVPVEEAPTEKAAPEEPKVDQVELIEPSEFPSFGSLVVPELLDIENGSSSIPFFLSGSSTAE